MRTETMPNPPIARRTLGPTMFALAIAVGVIVLFFGWGAATYNKLVRLDQGVQSQWAQVENSYQRRADLVPSLVETVKGAANFEKQTMLAVTEARARAQTTPAVPRGGDFDALERSQEELGQALTRLMVVVEAYPELKATESFRDLQAQLEGTENRIAVERMRFNQAAREFNSARDTFPTTVVAGLFGDRFVEKSYFQARKDAQLPPKVQF